MNNKDNRLSDDADLAKQEDVKGLRESEERMRLAFIASQQGLYDLNIVTGEAIVNPQYAEMLGYEFAEFAETNLNWRDRLHPDDKDQVFRVYEDYISGLLDKYAVEFRTMTKAGDWKWIRSVGKIVERDENGKPLRMIGTHIDISSRKLAEAALLEREQDLLTAQRLTKIGSWKWHVPTNVVTWSEGLCLILKYNQELPVPAFAEMSSFYTPESWIRLNEVVTRAFQTGEPYEMELDVIRTDGSIVNTVTRGAADYDSEGKIISLHGTVQDITERKKIEDELNRLFNLVPDMVCIASSDGFFKKLNKTWEETLGYSQEELLAIPYFELTHPEDKVRTLSELEKNNIGPIINFVNRYKCKDGSYRSLEWASTPSFDGTQLYAIARDVTERKRGERILQARIRISELASDISLDELLQKILDEAELLTNSKIGFFHFLEEDQTTLHLKAWSTNTLNTFCTADRKESHYDIEKAGVWLDCIRQRRPVIHNDYFALPDRKGLPPGHAPVFRELVVPIFYKDKILAIIGLGNKETDYNEKDVDSVSQFTNFTFDVVRRKQAEDSARQELEMRGILFENLPCVALILKKGTREIVYANEVARRTGAVRGKTCYETTANLQSPCSFCLASELWDTGNLKYVEVEHQGRNYEGRWVPLNDELYIHYIFDITERILAQQVQRENEERYQTILQTALDGFWILNCEGCLLEVNEAYCRMSGYTESELLAMNINDLDVVEETDETSQHIRKIITRGNDLFQSRHRRKDGSIYDVEISVQYRAIESGQIIAFIRDITDRKILDAERVKSERLESIGLLAGGIAHDFNNILMGIMGNISMALMEVEDGLDPSRYLESAEKASIRARGLTRQLLTFARGGAPMQAPTSMRELIMDSAEFATRGSKIKCDLALPGDLLPANVDQGQISQVINNLLINAIQAMPDGGNVLIWAENFSFDEPNPYDLKAGDYVKVVVSDNGSGIDPESLARIFEPYFSTKEKGSGLGLTTSYSIVKRHGGRLTVSSELGKGSVFTLYVPAESGMDIELAKTHQDLVMGSGSILLMDDEEEVINVAMKMLTRLGYQVEASRNGTEAIEKYRNRFQCGKPYSLVIMDLTIPGGMGGEIAIRELIKINPDVKAIVASGYSDDSVLANFKDHGFAGMVAKPFRLKEFSLVVAEVMTEAVK